MDDLRNCIENATSMAMICRIAAMAHQPMEQLEFMEALLADLAKARDDIAARTTEHGPFATELSA